MERKQVSVFYLFIRGTVYRYNGNGTWLLLLIAAQLHCLKLSQTKPSKPNSWKLCRAVHQGRLVHVHSDLITDSAANMSVGGTRRATPFMGSHKLRN